jgi:hypothetical protein
MFGIQERMANWQGPGPGPIIPPTSPTEPVIPNIVYTLPTTTYAPIAPSTPTLLAEQTSAQDELKAVLARYGLSGLFADLNAAVIADKTLVNNSDALFAKVRNNPVYIERFKGNAQRVAAGLPELTPAEYIAQEQSYKSVLVNSGLPRGFYDSQTDFANFISKDISPAELSNRIEMGYKQVMNASPDVVAQLKRMANLTDGDIAAYFLDPTKSQIDIEQKARAANIAAQASGGAGYQLTMEEAQALAKRGITTAQAEAGFGQIGQQAELYKTLEGEQQISQADVIAGTFTNEQAAQARIAQRKRQRQGSFEAGGGYATSNSLTSSTKNVGLSTVGQ